MKFTPGPWTVEPFLTPEHDDDPLGVYKVQPIFDNLTARYEADFDLDTPEGLAEEEKALDAIHEENVKVARLIAAAPAMYDRIREAIDFIWDEMRENPDKEDMDGSIMERLIELQTGLISTLRQIEEAQG